MRPAVGEILIDVKHLEPGVASQLHFQIIPNHRGSCLGRGDAQHGDSDDRRGSQK